MTFNAIALEIATLKRLGLFRKPISESNASRVVGRVTTVEMKMIFSSCPWKSSTVPTRMAPSERARSAMRMSTTCRRYVAITATDYPLRHASGLLGELKGAFAPKATKGLNTRLAGGLNGDLQPKFSRLCARYDDLTQVDNIHATLGKVEAVKVVMQDSIELALQNCVSLEAIDQKADELQSQAGMFKSKAKKLRSQMWWKKCKMQLLITFLVLTIIGVIVIIIMAYTGAFKDKDKKKDK